MFRGQEAAGEEVQQARAAGAIATTTAVPTEAVAAGIVALLEYTTEMEPSDDLLAPVVGCKVIVAVPPHRKSGLLLPWFVVVS